MRKDIALKSLAVLLGLSAVMAVGLAACSSSEDLSKEEQLAQVKAEAGQDGVVVNPHFMGREIYLRGEMNDYGVQAPYRLRAFAENTYCTLAPLRSDWSPYRFKFADAQWSQGTNFGYAVPPAVMREGSGKVQLNPNSHFEEVRFEPLQDGIYRFCIVYEDDVPYVTVTHLSEGRLTSTEEALRAEIERQFAVKSAEAAAKEAASESAAEE